MARYISLTFCLFFAAIIASGCQEKVKDDSRFRVDPEQERLADEQGFAVPDPKEVDLVEKMAYHRAMYKQMLEKLYDHYHSTGDTTRQGWARKELESQTLHYKYLMPAQLGPPTLRATDSIEQADQLYNEASKLYHAGFSIIDDKYKLKRALKKFNELIVKYPSSDKIDDSAYRAGQIYQHFKDYEVAAVYYQRAFQWSSTTPYPARYKAARVMDKLRMRDQALTLYRLALQHEAKYEKNAEVARQRIIEITSKEEEREIQLEEQTL